MKKILIYLLAFLLLSGSFSTLAADTPTLVIAENNLSGAFIKLESQLGKSFANAPALIRVIDEGKGEGVDKLIWAQQTRADNNGKLTATIDVSGYSTGDYVFAADVYGLSAPIKTSPSVKIYSSGEKSALWTRVQNAVKDKNTAEIEWIIQNRGDYLQLDIAGYNALLEKQAQFLINTVNCTYTTLDDFVRKFALNIQLMNISDNTSVEALFDDFSITASVPVVTYNGSAIIKNIVLTALKANEATLTVDNFVLRFNTAIILKELDDNKELWTGYENILRKYDDEIGISFEVYDDASNQSEIMNDMLAVHDRFTSLTLIKEKFEELLTPSEDEDNETPSVNPEFNSGRFESSSGGGGGGGGVSKVLETQTPVTSKTLFSDTGCVAWAEEAISYLAERGIINGRSEGSFAPNDNVTRAEAVKLLVSAFNITSENTENIFTDVKSSDWYYGYVTAAYNSGLVNGLTLNTFAPDAPVSRQDLCVMISRIIGNVAENKTLTFSDSTQIADYAKDAVALLVEKGIINGMDNNRFAPSAYATRAQAAKILYEMIKTGV